MPNSTSPTGDHSDLLTEAQLQKLCGIMYDFARQVGYGLRTYNREVGSSPSSGNAINIHQLAVLLKSMPEGMDHPLAYAMNSFQAFTVCLHLIHSYTSWREYGTEVPYYRWTNKIIPESDTNTLAYLQFHLEAVCKPQRENGLQLPPFIKQHAWNQLAVESGYAHECVRKKSAVQNWEAEFATMDAPNPLFDGDGLFPPKLQGHPNWVYDTGRVATAWASNLEPEGLRPAYHGMTPEPGRDSASMPKATPAHGPKRARTDESHPSSSSSSAQPPPPPQPEVEPVRDMWMEAPIPYGAKETMLAMDFDLMAQNRASRTTATLGESLRGKGWNELRRISPQFSGNYTCQGTQETLSSMVQAIGQMTDTQKATLTVHIHLSMQSVVVDNIIWPFSDIGSGVTLRLEAQQQLKATYVEPIIEMTARAPIININHDPRFVAAGSEESKKVEHSLTGFQAMGVYVALELRVRGCVVTHGSSFWSKMACQLKQSSTGIHMNVVMGDTW